MRISMFALLAILLVLFPLSSRANEPGVVALVPSHVGLTMSHYPSLCWMPIDKQAVDSAILFNLLDSRSSKPTLEVTLPNPIQNEKNVTCHCISLKDYGIKLEPNIQYRWYVSVVRNSESASHDGASGGLIEFCGFSDCLMEFEEMFSRCDKDSVMSRARSGFWYDSISCLCELIEANPQDLKLRQLLDRLLKDVGIILVRP